MKPITICCMRCALERERESIEKGEEVEYEKAWMPISDPRDTDVLACARWDDALNLPGREKRRCADCGTTVSIAPSSKWLLGEGPPPHN